MLEPRLHLDWTNQYLGEIIWYTGYSTQWWQTVTSSLAPYLSEKSVKATCCISSTNSCGFSWQVHCTGGHEVFPTLPQCDYVPSHCCASIYHQINTSPLWYSLTCCSTVLCNLTGNAIQTKSYSLLLCCSNAEFTFVMTPSVPSAQLSASLWPAL